MATIDWNIKPALKDLFQRSRWETLTVYLVHANIRNRAYPGDEQFAEYGIAHATAVNARRWLTAHGCLDEVPYEQRVAAERRLPPAKKVYQLTGIIRLDDGSSHPYLFFNSSDFIQSDSSKSEQTPSSDNSSNFEHKDNKRLKVEHTRKRDGVFDAFGVAAYGLPESFGSKTVGRNASMISDLVQAAKECSPDTDNEMLALLVRDAYRRWRGATDLHVPRLALKFSGWFVWCLSHDETEDKNYPSFQHGSASQQRELPTVKKVRHPDKPGMWITEAEHRQLMAEREKS